MITRLRVKSDNFVCESLWQRLCENAQKGGVFMCDVHQVSGLAIPEAAKSPLVGLFYRFYRSCGFHLSWMGAYILSRLRRVVVATGAPSSLKTTSAFWATFGVSSTFTFVLAPA